MFSAAVSITLASTFAFSPFTVDRGSGRFAAPLIVARMAPTATTTAEPAPADPSAPPAEDAGAAPGWDEEPIADPPPPSTPAPAPVADVPVSGPPTHEVTRPRTHKGIGLMVGAGVAGATAWGLAIGKMVLVTRCSDNIDNTDESNVEVTIFQCFKDAQGIIGLSVAGWFANWATWGLAGAAGGVRGKHDGVGYAWDGKPNRASAGFIGGGAAMLGVGVIGIGLTRILSLSLLRCSVDTTEDVNAINSCLKRKFNGYFAGVQVSSSLVAAGLGMMIYGIVYRKNRQQFENRRVTDLRIVPDTSLFRASSDGNYNGLALTGRF